MGNKVDSKCLSMNSSVEHQLEMYRHNQNQAQKFLRFVLTGLTVLGISIGTAVLTSWERILEILPNSAEGVVNDYNVAEEFVHSTNELNLILALSAIFLAFLMALDSLKFMFRVINQPRINQNISMAECSNATEDNAQIIDSQFNNLRAGYFLAKWAGVIAILGEGMAITAIIGRADFLAIVDLSVLIITGILFSRYVPIALIDLTEKGLSWKSSLSKDWLENIQNLFHSGSNRNSHPVPHVSVIIMIVFVWDMFAFYGGIFGLHWLLTAFIDEIDLLSGLQAILSRYIWILVFILLIPFLAIFIITMLTEYQSSSLNFKVRKHLSNIVGPTDLDSDSNTEKSE